MGVVFILGAAASSAAGAPLMSNFLARARDLYDLGEIEEHLRSSFERVFKLITALQRVHYKCFIDDRNIESLFAVVEMGKLLGFLPQHNEKQIQQLADDMKIIISCTIEKSMMFPINPGGLLQDPEPYEEFAKLHLGIRHQIKPNRDVSVITFNYDLALYRSLAAKGLKPDYCFAGQIENEGIPLLKLHGSQPCAGPDKSAAEEEKERDRSRYRQILGGHTLPNVPLDSFGLS